MIGGIPEKDWKYLSSLRAGLIERYCEKTLSKVRSILASGKSGNNLEQLQKIFQHIEKRDKALIRDLNDFRRSNAIIKILAIRKLGLFSAEEFDGFSDEVKSIIKAYEEW